MDTPIQPRVVKPRIHQRPALVYQGDWSTNGDYYRVHRGWHKRFVCYCDNVAAVGKTIEGAYKNWVSLRDEHLTVLSSDRDFK